METTAAHPKTHGVHVNLAWVGFITSLLCHVSVRVWVDGNKDLDFLSASLSDRFHESFEARVRVFRAINDELALRKLIDFLQFVLMGLDFVHEVLVKDHYVIFGA